MPCPIGLILCQASLNFTIMKAGTIIELPDGRRGTVVYNSLDGVGIKWGEYNITQEDLTGNGNLTHGAEVAPTDYDYFVEAMLRKPYPLAIKEGIECVGNEYEVIREGK